MKTGLIALQMVSAESATEAAASSQTRGQGKVERADVSRKQLQEDIRVLEEKAGHLQAKLEDALDTEWYEDVGNFLFGGDDAGDIGSKLERNAAEMEKSMKEIQIAQAQIDQALGDLQTAQQDLGGRVNDRQKAYDEAGKAAKAAQA